MTSVVVERSTARASRKSFKQRLKRLVFMLAVASLLAAGVWYAYGWWTVGRFVESTDDAYVGGDITAIAPHIAGFVATIDITDNEHVKAGQLLLTLDDRDMRAAMDRTLSILAERRATLAGLQARVPLQKSIIDAAVAELDAKTAQSVFALADARRYMSISNSNAVTRQETDRAFSLGEAAKAGTASARAALAGARQQLEVLKTQIADAEAQVGEAQALGRTAELNLGYAQLRAPVDGYVGNRAARVGAYVTVGSYLLTIIPARGLWVDANFKEDQLAHVRLGDAATVIADVAPDVTIHGHVTSLAPGTGAIFSVIPPENATGNFTKIVQRVPVRITLDGDDGALGLLRPGLSTTVSIDTRRATR